MIRHRIIIAAPIAALVTVFLFTGMRALITSKGPQEIMPVDPVAIQITRTARSEDVRYEDRDLRRPEAEDLPPPPPTVEHKRPARPDLTPLALPNMSAEIGMDLTLAVGAPQDRNVQPKIRVPPVYPSRALSRGIEGWVELEFSVDEQGNVIEPRVVRADPENIFDRASLRAVRRFKYNPKLVNGEAVRQTGIRFLFEFKLEGNG